MKSAISVPDHVFRSADRLAARLGVSRSELYSKALAAMVKKHRDDLVTTRLNEVYACEPSPLDPALYRTRSRSLSKPKW
jgi:hypothetical protein